MPASANPNAKGNDIAGLIGAALVPVAGPFLVAARYANDAKKNFDTQRRNELVKAWLLGTLAALAQAIVVALILRFARLG